MSINNMFMLGGDLPVQRLGFGAMRITGKGVWGLPSNKEEALRVLRRCIELGVNFIDTADAYGPYVSEELIAEALYPYPEGLVIGTKGGLTRPGPGEWVVDASPKHLREALEGSLRRLKLDCIDLYQLHRIDASVPMEETLEALFRMQQEGKIRHIGLSEVTAIELEKACAMGSIASTQNLYNVTERKHQSVLALCEAKGIGFIPWFPLDTGDLIQPGGRLENIAQKYQATPAQIALSWLLHISPVMLPIPGTSSVAHLEENMKALDIDLSLEDIALINNIS